MERRKARIERSELEKRECVCACVCVCVRADPSVVLCPPPQKLYENKQFKHALKAARLILDQPKYAEHPGAPPSRVSPGHSSAVSNTAEAQSHALDRTLKTQAYFTHTHTRARAHTHNYTHTHTHTPCPQLSLALQHVHRCAAAVRHQSSPRTFVPTHIVSTLLPTTAL